MTDGGMLIQSGLERGVSAQIMRPLTADAVIAEATQLWNGGAGLDAILVTGGGAHLLGSRITAHFRHAQVVEEPVFANALGYWRFAQYLGK